VNKIWDESDMMCSYEVRPVADFEDGSLETKVYQEEPKIMAMMGKLMGEETMEMQSLVFMKTDGWTLESAQAWVEEHSAELKGGPGSGKPSGYGGGGTREASSSAATVSSGENCWRFKRCRVNS
jgi:hypothetical protein